MGKKTHPVEPFQDSGKQDPKPLKRAMIQALGKGAWPEALVRNSGAITREEQISLLDSTVAVVGLGGLGGHSATLLARAGVGKLILCDKDAFEPSNANRQVFCVGQSLGRSKSGVAGERLREMAPFVEVEVVSQAFDMATEGRVLDGAGCCVDGTDNVTTRKRLFAACKKRGIPLVLGAVSAWSGHVCTFLPHSEPIMDDLYPKDMAGEEPVSVVSPTPAVLAGFQAMEVLRLCMGRTAAFEGKMLFVDGQTGETRLMRI